MTRDHYAEIHALAARLANEGHAQHASALVDAVRAGATSTEILMAVRWRLSRLEGLDSGLSAQTKGDIAELRIRLDELLA